MVFVPCQYVCVQTDEQTCGEQQLQMYYSLHVYVYIRTYPTFGKPTIPIFKFVPIRPIRGGGPVASSFFFGGIFEFLKYTNDH